MQEEKKTSGIVIGTNESADEMCESSGIKELSDRQRRQAMLDQARKREKNFKKQRTMEQRVQREKERIMASKGVSMMSEEQSEQSTARKTAAEIAKEKK